MKNYSENKKSRLRVEPRAGQTIGSLTRMSLSQFITKLGGNQEDSDRFMRVFGFCLKLYLVFACVWTICYLVGEILEKMGVG